MRRPANADLALGAAQRGAYDVLYEWTTLAPWR